MTVATLDPATVHHGGAWHQFFPWRKVGGFLLRNAADWQVAMRIQFVTVPGSEKVLMCISETETSGADVDQVFKAGLGVGAVLITQEVVYFEPANPEDASEAEAVHPCEDCLARPGGKWVASRACGHA